MQNGNFIKRLQNKELLLLDGAMGTEILNRGVSTSLPLWSAEALLTYPEVVRGIHEDYIKAGADIITTNTFSTTKRNFSKKKIGDKAYDMTLLACHLARDAKKIAKKNKKIYIAGSVAPLEDCYSPQLTPPQKDIEREHDAFVKILRDGEVDFILIETMITLRETLAAIQAAEKYNLSFGVCFCCNDNLELLSGEPLKKVIQNIEKHNPLFIGVNCVSIPIATKTVKYLHKISNLPVCVYAQGNGAPEKTQGWQFHTKENDESYITAAGEWIDDGAQIVGGCCGTTPRDIKKIYSTYFLS